MSTNRTFSSAWIVVLTLHLLAGNPAVAQPSEGSAEQVRFVYEQPKRTILREIRRRMQQGRVLERVATMIGLVRLPDRLTYRMKGCAGEINAWYDPDHHSVTICYEFIESVRVSAPRRTSSPVKEAQDPLVGAIALFILHESAHALFDLLHVPVLGREEDAADQVAAYVLLQLGPNEARRVVDDGAAYFATNAKHELVDKGAFADEHGLSWQRFYNLACLAYGSDTRRYRYVVDRGYLPRDRAERCEEEYAQIVLAFDKLIMPHLRVQPGPGEPLRRAFRRSMQPS